MSAATYLQNTISEPIAVTRPIRFSTGSIVGLIDAPGQPSGLIAALTNLGIQREAIEVTRTHSLAPGQPGIFNRIANLLCYIGPERELSRRYRAALESGSTIVTVRKVPADRQDAVTGILTSAGGHFIHNFGRFTVRKFAS